VEFPGTRSAAIRCSNRRGFDEDEVRIWHYGRTSRDAAMITSILEELDGYWSEAMAWCLAEARAQQETLVNIVELMGGTVARYTCSLMNMDRDRAYAWAETGYKINQELRQGLEREFDGQPAAVKNLEIRLAYAAYCHSRAKLRAFAKPMIDQLRQRKLTDATVDEVVDLSQYGSFAAWREWWVKHEQGALN
jgi:hypothetical protein